MTFFGGPSTGLAGSGSYFTGSMSRSDVLGRKYQPFANPFFDQASTYMPPTVKSLFGFCRYYHLTHGIINAVGTKAAEYPITDLILQHKDKGVVDKWEPLLLGGAMQYRVHQFETNLDYFVTGNAFISPSFPFRKILSCGSCNAKLDALDHRDRWRYTNFRWWLTCPRCGQTDFARSHDEYSRRVSEINLIKWDPANVTIFYNEATGRRDYAYDLSDTFRNEIMMGRKDLVATTPEIFLEAAKSKRMLVFDKRSVYHMRRPSMSGQFQGWGVPLLLPVLKDAFYMQVMKKAQESILLTHLVPQIFLFPQPATAGADPFTAVNLVDWRDHIRRELARQRLDPSYYGILPFPLGHQVIGENGRQLLLMQEIRMMAELIVTGMGFPADLVFGQGTYAGTSVNMRMLENFFLSNVQEHYLLLDWVMNHMSAFMGWPKPEASFKPFKMADDLQRQAFAFQLNQAGKLSDATLLSLSDHKIEEESKLQLSEAKMRAEALKQQQLLAAEIAGEAMVVQAKYQAKAQEVMAEAQGAAMAAAGQDPNAAAFEQSQGSGLAGAQQGVPLDQVAQIMAQNISGLPPTAREQQMNMLAQQSPELASLVQQIAGTGPAMAGGGGGVDMRPMPEQLPPRRAGAV